MVKTEGQSMITEPKNKIRDVILARIASAPAQTIEQGQRGRFGAMSVASIKHPQENQDFLLFDEANQLAILCDGMGGYENGFQASRMGAFAIDYYLKEHLSYGASAEETEACFKDALRFAHKMLSENVSEGGTTVAVAKIMKEQGKKTVVFASAGDSRIIRVNRKGEISPITQDDNLVYQATVEAAKNDGYVSFPEEVVAQAALHGFDTKDDKILISSQQFESIQNALDMVVNPLTLDPLTHYFFQHRNLIFSGLGQEFKRVLVQSGYTELHPGETIVMGTDGIFDNLPAQDIRKAVQKNPDPYNLARTLVKAAATFAQDERNVWDPKANPGVRGKKDDISCICVA